MTSFSKKFENFFLKKKFLGKKSSGKYFKFSSRIQKPTPQVEARRVLSGIRWQPVPSWHPPGPGSTDLRPHLPAPDGYPRPSWRPRPGGCRLGTSCQRVPAGTRLTSSWGVGFWIRLENLNYFPELFLPKNFFFQKKIFQILGKWRHNLLNPSRFFFIFF